MSAEEQEKTENSSSEGTDGGSLLSDLASNQKPTHNQTAHPADKKQTLFRKLKDFIKSYQFQKFRKDPKIWFELAALVVLICYTRYAGQQARTMNKTLEEIRHQTPALKEAAEAAKSAAVTANAALGNSQQQFRNEQRPYIWLTPGVVTPSESMTDTPLPELKRNGWPLIINVQAKNGGHSPAVKIINTKTIAITGPPQNAKRQAEAYKPDYIQSSGSGGAANLAPNTFLFLPSPERIEITDALLNDLQHDRKRIYILGRVQYQDIFTPETTTPYETAFCVRVTPAGLPFAGCDVNQSWIK